MKRDEITAKVNTTAAVDWHVSASPVPYLEAIAAMEKRVAGIAHGNLPEQVWLLEHPALYTAGTSARDADLIDPTRFPVFKTGRGGQYTYHGPGQRVAYVMLDLRQRGGDVRAFVASLEQWLIATLATFGVSGDRREDRVGVWVRHEKDESKIAALGIRVRGGVTYHGISLNVNPDPSHFDGIIPCGVTNYGVTSLHDLGIRATLAEVDMALRQQFETHFGPTVTETH